MPAQLHILATDNGSSSSSSGAKEGAVRGSEARCLTKTLTPRAAAAAAAGGGNPGGCGREVDQLCNQSSERGVSGLTRIFFPRSTCHSVVVYVHSVDA